MPSRWCNVGPDSGDNTGCWIQFPTSDTCQAFVVASHFGCKDKSFVVEDVSCHDPYATLDPAKLEWSSNPEADS